MVCDSGSSPVSDRVDHEPRADSDVEAPREDPRDRGRRDVADVHAAPLPQKGEPRGEGAQEHEGEERAEPNVRARRTLPALVAQDVEHVGRLARAAQRARVPRAALRVDGGAAPTRAAAEVALIDLRRRLLGAPPRPRHGQRLEAHAGAGAVEAVRVGERGAVARVAAVDAALRARPVARAVVPGERARVPIVSGLAGRARGPVARVGERRLARRARAAARVLGDFADAARRARRRVGAADRDRPRRTRERRARPRPLDVPPGLGGLAEERRVARRVAPRRAVGAHVGTRHVAEPAGFTGRAVGLVVVIRRVTVALEMAAGRARVASGDDREAVERVRAVRAVGARRARRETRVVRPGVRAGGARAREGLVVLIDRGAVHVAIRIGVAVLEAVGRDRAGRARVRVVPDVDGRVARRVEHRVEDGPPERERAVVVGLVQYELRGDVDVECLRRAAERRKHDVRRRGLPDPERRGVGHEDRLVGVEGRVAQS
mmetsp:Transcript_6053/g.25340  ORF Transcript_6053/g.25340 Transcript_6053/m.25340 type:complete len:490 (-) Transcript_6053:196-1665(-)